MCTKPMDSTTSDAGAVEQPTSSLDIKVLPGLPKLKQAQRPRLESEETLSDDEHMVIDEEGDDDVIGRLEYSGWHSFMLADI